MDRSAAVVGSSSHVDLSAVPVIQVRDECRVVFTWTSSVGGMDR